MASKTRSATFLPVPRLKSTLRRMWLDEDGSILHFVLIVFILMLAVAGMGVDVMRHEENRALLQATLDRSVLASASLNQETDEAGAEAIVRDYFVKSGVRANLQNVEADIVLNNSRRVSAEADGQLNTIFMRWLGVPRLPVLASSTADETVQDIEIAMVLDVSGSMVQGGSTRLANLKLAANDFVDIVLGNDQDRRISIGMVPFNGQVNLGQSLRQEFRVTHQDGVPSFAANSRCVDLPENVYETLTLGQTLPMPATTWADSFSMANGLRDSNGDGRPDSVPISYSAPGNSPPVATNRWCPSEAGNTVLLPTRNENMLENRINGLVGVGATSINAGMRWGLTLLDPASQQIFRNGLSSGTVQGRPFPFDRPNTVKYLVLMTDGAHFPEERINDRYREGVSNLLRAPSDGNYSYRTYNVYQNPARPVDSQLVTRNHPKGYPFWVPHRGEWQWRAWNGSNPPPIPATCRDDDDDENDDGVPECDRYPSGASRLTWQQVWGGDGTSWQGVRTSWVAWQIFARSICNIRGTNNGICMAEQYDEAMGTAGDPGYLRTLTSTSDMDEQLWDLCEIAHREGVIIFGIAFQAPAAGQTAIRQCVSNRGNGTLANYFEPANGNALQEDFRKIASQINALKLLQ